MTKLTKLLPPEAAPAQTILERAHDLVMTSAEREVWPETIETAEGTVTIAVEERRPLEVGECFVDEKGEFWAVRPAVEPVLRVTGDIDLLREAAGALINRGVRVAPSEDGFMVLPLPNIAKMLGMIGLEVAEAEEAFNPIVFRQTHAGGCGCGCGGHHHHHHHHHGHDADEVFISWGEETHKKFTKAEIERILKALEDADAYGIFLRAKGYVANAEGEKWIHFDYVPGEPDIRDGGAMVTGRICVIGSKLNEEAVAKLFGVEKQ